MKKTVILISGSGSNLQAIIDNSKDIGINIELVISNRDDAFGLKRAQNSNIKTNVIISKGKTREDFENQLITEIDKIRPEIIVLAGFMRNLTANFINKYKGRILNIHPSLLPKFKGLHTHARAIDAGEKKHGATVHLVSTELDSGKIIMQAEVDIMPNDTPKSLAKRVLEQEHILYPKAIYSFIEQKL